MMGDCGFSPGMMSGPGLVWRLQALDLNETQQPQVNKILDELRKKNWDLLGKMQDEAARLRDLYGADKIDRAQLSAAYKRLGELRESRVENTLDAYEKIEALLTPEQRKAMRRSMHTWDTE